MKDDQNFNEAEAWELRKKLNEKDAVSENPLFKFVFCDWINIEGKSPEMLSNYGNHEKSFFKINESVNTSEDLFYLVINVRIVNMRQSVFIFVCKKVEWDTFLKENLKDPKECLGGTDKNTQFLKKLYVTVSKKSLIRCLKIYSVVMKVISHNHI